MNEDDELETCKIISLFYVDGEFFESFKNKFTKEIKKNPETQFHQRAWVRDKKIN